MIALAAGMLIGWAFTRRWRVRVAAVLIAAIALAVIAPRLPDMPVASLMARSHSRTLSPSASPAQHAGYDVAGIQNGYQLDAR